MKKVFLVAAVRTPMGSFGGALSSLSATALGSIAMKGALDKAKVNANTIEEVFFGNVCQANLGQAPARQAALRAEILNTTPCTTVNKVCSSGMKSIMFGAQSIMLGIHDVVMTGGMESMSNIPYYVPKARWGYKYGEAALVDGLQKDGLADAYNHGAMGVFADATAKEHGFSREEQDRFSIQSYERAAAATEAGRFKDEIVPVSIPQRRGDPIIVDQDEEFKKVKFEKIPNLRPAFTKDGTVTAANASTINDGAAALILMSEAGLKKTGATPIAEILAFADAAHEPEWFTTAPTLAAPKAMANAGLGQEDVDIYEVNEAFAVVTLAFNKKLGIKEDIVNVNGGAVSLGHPLGASGARIVTTLNGVLHQQNKEIGCATLCNGGGGASAIVLKAM